jgi:hypothetical protein
MTHVVSTVLHEADPGFAVAVYPVIGEPPFAGDGVHVMAAFSPASAMAIGLAGGRGALAAIGTYWLIHGRKVLTLVYSPGN